MYMCKLQNCNKTTHRENNAARIIRNPHKIQQLRHNVVDARQKVVETLDIRSYACICVNDRSITCNSQRKQRLALEPTSPVASDAASTNTLQHTNEASQQAS